VSGPLPSFTIKWNSLAETSPCDRCDRPVHGEIGPAIFAVGTWHPICDTCVQTDPALLADLWNVRAELDRGQIGPHTAAWLDRLEGYDAIHTRQALAEHAASALTCSSPPYSENEGEP
jgi:hypothetical protein